MKQTSISTKHVYAFVAVAITLLLFVLLGCFSRPVYALTNKTINVDFNAEAEAMTPQIGWLNAMDPLVQDGRIIPLHPRENRYDTFPFLPPELEGSQLAMFHNNTARINALGANAYPILGYMPSYLRASESPASPPIDYRLWKQQVKDYVQYAADNHLNINKWNVWNEYWGVTEDQHNEMYKQAWNAIKEIMPNATVIGSSNDHFDAASLQRFMDYSFANGLTIDNISWHEIIDPGASYQGHQNVIKQYAQDKESLGIKEYNNEEFGSNDDTQNLSQGNLVNWLAVNEDASVGSSFKSVWDAWNSLSDTLAIDPSTSTFATRRTTWWAMKAYGEMSGTRVQVIQPGNGTYAIAAKDVAQGEAKILIGNKDAGWNGDAVNLTLNLSNQPFAGSTVRIDKYRVTSTENDGLVLQATENPTSTANLTTSLSLANDDAWLIVIKKQSSAPGSFLPKTPDDEDVATALPTFTWTTASGAATYNLKVSVNKDMSSPVINQTGITSASYTATAPLTVNTKYYWTVQAVNAYGTKSAENNTTYSFTVKSNVNVPGRFEIGNIRTGSSSISITPEFTWTPAANASSYTLLVSANPDLSSPIINDSVSLSSAYVSATNSYAYTSAASLSNNTTYYAKLIANNAYGSRDMADPTITFLTKPLGNSPASFSLASPANGATNVNKRSRLGWSSANGAFFYKLEIATDSGFSNIVWHADQIKTPAYTLEPDSLAANTTYYWRVTAYDKTLTYSYAAASRSFTTENKATSPLLKTVTSGNRKATLYYSTVNNATGYAIKYGTSPGNYTTTITGASGSPYTVTGLSNGTTYYFAVVAVNANGESAIFNEVSAAPAYSVNQQAKTELARNTAAASSAVNSSWSAANINDGNVNTAWSSVVQGGQTGNESVYIDLGKNYDINRVMLIPRTASGVIYCFPIDFKFQYSSDGATWTDVPGQSYKGYTTPVDANGEKFDFASPVNARYLKLVGTKFAADTGGAYYLQMAEMYAYSPQAATDAVSVSSTANASFPATNIIDANAGTAWSSASQAGSTGTEWVSIDMGRSNAINRIKLTPWAYSGTVYGFPQDFKFQSSANGITWTDISGQSYTGYANPANANGEVFDLSSPVTARYIRLVATKFRTDSGGAYYLQMADMYAYAAKQTALASSEFNGSWLAANAADGNASSGWSSSSQAGQTGNEWIALDKGETGWINQVTLIPRTFNGTVYCFPQDFKLQSSIDGTTWTDVPGQSYAGYASPTTAKGEIFSFASAVRAKQIRLVGTKFRSDGGNYYMQIAEMSAYYTTDVPAHPKRLLAIASTTQAGWYASGIIDSPHISTAESGWSSALQATMNGNEWIYIDMGYTSDVKSVTLKPRTFNGTVYGFPQDFKFQSSADGITWTDIPGQSYTNYSNPSSGNGEFFNFGAAVTARYIKLVGTKFRTDQSGNYDLQMDEMYLYN